MILIDEPYRSPLVTIRRLLAKTPERPIRTVRQSRIVQFVDLRPLMH
jgi:hypothetical protein